MSPFVILGALGLFCPFYSHFYAIILLANSVDPDQMPHYVASDLSLHCLLMTFYGFQGKNGLILFITSVLEGLFYFSFSAKQCPLM